MALRLASGCLTEPDDELIVDANHNRIGHVRLGQVQDDQLGLGTVLLSVRPQGCPSGRGRPTVNS